MIERIKGWLRGVWCIVRTISRLAGPFLRGKWRAVAVGLAAISPVIDQLLRKGGVMPEDQMEKKLRELIASAISLSGSSGISLALKILTSFLPKLNSLVGEFRGPREEWLPRLMVAMDGMIGNEEDALIGPNGSLIAFDIPMVDDEKVYDILLQALEAALLDAKEEAK
jgi:hypothetical protein